MDYEQKYKEALGWMKSLYGGLHGKTKEEAEKYFPELKESEDERVKKELIELISCMHDADPRKKGWIAWLEKQGEQETDEWKEGNIIRHGGILALVIRGRRVMKSNGEIFTVQYPDEWVKAAPKEIEHFLNEFEKQGEQPQGKSALEAAKEEKVDNANKVEPKFRVGDFVCNKNGKIAHIEDIKVDSYGTLRYYVRWSNGNKSDPMPCFFDENHLWTINDAKDGDVLASGHLVFIFKVIHGVWLNCHCSAHNDRSFIADSYDLMTNKYFSEVHPATKEQRDFLFAKMKEAGYEWDAEKKVMKKFIEEKSPAESLGISQEKYEEIVNECIYGSDNEQVSSEKIGKNDTLLDLLNKMPSYITVDGLDYHFVLKNIGVYIAYYECEGEEGRDKIIFWMAGDPVDLLTAMLEKLKKEGLL